MALAQTILGGIKDLAGSYLEKKKAENGIYTVKAANITPRANQYATAMNDAVNRLNSIEKFSYDQKNDPLYQQYAEMYQKNAKLAMQDTVGQATALTGGYGSSYAETAGQAMYNQAMSGLNDKALDLYRTSLDAYNSYADLAAKQASAATSAFNADQGAIDTEVSAAQWNANFEEQQRQKAADIAMENQKLRQQQLEFGLNYALDAAKTGYQMYSDTRDFNWNKAVDERNFGYQKERDKVSDEQYASDLQYKYDAMHSNEAQAAKELAYKYDALHSSEAQNAKDLAYRYAAAGLNADGTLSAAERERLEYQYGGKNYKAAGTTGSGGGTNNYGAQNSGVYMNTDWKATAKDYGISEKRREELDFMNLPYRTAEGYALKIADMLDEGTINQKEAKYLLKRRSFSDEEIKAMFS